MNRASIGHGSPIDKRLPMAGQPLLVVACRSTTATQTAYAVGLRLIVIDRPGMSDSSFQPARQVLDWPREGAVADLLSLELRGTRLLRRGSLRGRGWVLLAPLACRKGLRGSYYPEYRDLVEVRSVAETAEAAAAA